MAKAKAKRERPVEFVVERVQTDEVEVLEYRNGQVYDVAATVNTPDGDPGRLKMADDIARFLNDRAARSISRGEGGNR